MPPPVIAGVDGSAESLAAAEWAARESLRRKRPLRLVHAWSWHPRQDGEPATAAQRLAARRALRQAEERIGRVCPQVCFEEEQVEGPATAALLRAAAQADVLALGSRGLSGFTGFLVGSVALGVVARAARPVVLVPAAGADGYDTAGPEETGRRDVVLGLDLADPCEEVIEFAFEAAQGRGSRLRAVHAWQQPVPFGFGPGEIGLIGEPRRADEWRDFMSAVLHTWRDKYPGVDVVETLTEGRPAAPLIRAASAASLLVVGRRIAQGPALARTGPVAHAVIHHAGCPVAVVPHE
ncbi:universal stress protein [Streptomyces griseorubiginosus]|uniref:universal stress protein n=1 Tax=Streptomyces griseorubiginosus TaxID=67304 RepID=UPI00113FD800|nr:universal stress protein [Streptomyces griseorubiginosus]